MAIRADVTVDWSVSPRIITVASPSVEITIQDLLDTCRSLEAQPNAMDDKSIIDAAGKEQLGGSVYVGLTATLQNALLAFESRVGPEYTQCNVNGGNLVALTDDLVSYFITPISPTAFTQIVVTASSSATQTEQSAIQYSSFGDVVTIDALRGTPGTDFPAGTKEYPVDNADDAVFIGADVGIDTISIIGDFTFEETDVIDDYTIRGQNAGKSHIHIPTGCSCQGCEFNKMYLTGILDGGSILERCIIDNLDYINGVVYNTMLNPGTISLGGNAVAHFIDCYSGVPGSGTPTIDMAGSGNSLGMRNYNGGIRLINKTGPEDISIDLNSGQIIIDDTVINGTVVCRGIGKLTDNSANGATIFADDLLNKDNIAKATLSSDLTNYSEPGTLGEASLQVYYNGYIAIDATNGEAGTDYPVGTRTHPVNNIADAFTLSERFKIFKFGFSAEPYTFLATDSLRGYALFSQSGSKTIINIISGCSTHSTHFRDVNVQGTLNGRCMLDNCIVGNLYNFEGVINKCGFNETATLKFGTNNDAKSIIYECQTIGEPTLTPTFDFTNIGTEDVTIKNYIGTSSITGKTQNQFTSIVLSDGVINIDNTCTAGTLKVSGCGVIGTDDSAGTSVEVGLLVNSNYIAESVLNHPFVHDDVTHLDHDTMGGLTARESYDGVVVIDTVNGSSGTLFPAGMPHQPVNNISDALYILEEWHLSTIKIQNDLILPINTNISGITFISGATIDRMITIPNTCITNGTIFKDIIVTGTLNGRVELYNCEIETLSGFTGMMDDCTLYDLIEVAPSSRTSMIKNCLSGGISSVWATIDLNNSKVEIRNYCGNIELIGKISTSITGISLNCGIVKIADTCTTGEIKIGGIGSILEDNSGSGCIIDDRLLNVINIGDGVWVDDTAVNLVSDVDFIKNIEGGRWIIDNNQMVFYADDNTTEVARFNLFDGAGNPTEINVLERVKV